MDQVMHILAEHFVHLLISQHAKAGRVAEGAPVFKINPINGLGSGVEEESEFLFTFAQCLFRPLALCDVHHHSHHAQQPALRVKECTTAFFQPNYRTIGGQHAIADLGCRVLRSKVINRAYKLRAVIWMDSGRYLPTSKLLCAVTDTEDIHVQREIALRTARQRPVVLLMAELWAPRYTLLNLFHSEAHAATEGKQLLPDSTVQIRDQPTRESCSRLAKSSRTPWPRRATSKEFMPCL
jgi:hypothetical protein